MSVFEDLFDTAVKPKKVNYQKRATTKKSSNEISNRSIDCYFFEANEPLEFDDLTVREFQAILLREMGESLRNPKVGVNPLWDIIEWVVDDDCHDFSYLACMQAFGIDKWQAYEVAHELLSNLHNTLSVRKKDSQQFKVLDKTLSTYFS